MKVFVAGATGAVGAQLVPQLTQAGHEVSAMTRSADGSDAIAATGAEVVVADALDRDAVLRAVGAAKPDVVIHQLTALSSNIDLRKFDQAFALTNRLRTEGLDHLLEAARSVSAKRFVAQSYTGWNNDRTGAALQTEDAPFDDDPKGGYETLASINYLEQTLLAATDIEGLILRYGNLYGPGTGISRGGAMVEMIRKRRFPIVGSGSGVWSFTHIKDAAGAATAVLDQGRPGVYNIVDDHPAPVSEWLPELARVVGAKPPRRVPAWLGKLFVGEFGVTWLTAGRGAANAKAKQELVWTPLYPDWREGFRTGLS